jgi:hypothetical protein
MDTTVTGIFPDRQHAAEAVARLRDAGFGTDQVQLVDEGAPERHEFVQARTADRGRAVAFGIVFGSLVGLLAGALLGSVFEEPSRALLFGGAVGAVGGGVLGLLVGGATRSQVGGEIERTLDAGRAIVSVATDGAHQQRAYDVLAKLGAVNLVSSPATFRGGVLPIAPAGQPQEEVGRRADS